MSDGIVEDLIHIPTADGIHLAFWKIYQTSSDPRKAIFLTHGTFSDKRICLGIASYMAEKGYTCWILEWRSHGASSQSPHPFNFETIAKVDVLAAFSYLRKEAKLNTWDCITHSGGGICLTIFLIEHPTYRESVKTMSLFGCQAFGAAHTAKNYAKIWLGKYLGALLGYLPARRFGRPHNESYFTMKQWYNWNLSGRFLGDAGEDYQQLMAQIKIPVLSVCAQGDPLVAPSVGCEKFLEAFENSQNQLLFYAKSEGHLEDYDHSRILHSSSAKKEIWPIVLEWMRRNE